MFPLFLLLLDPSAYIMCQFDNMCFGVSIVKSEMQNREMLLKKMIPGQIGYKSERVSKEIAALEDNWARIISGESSTDDKLLLKLLKSVEIRLSPDEKDHCWMWAEYVDSQTGYGRMSNKRFNTRLTHRISYMLAHSVPN